MRLPRTIIIQVGKKLSGKSKDEICEEILRVFGRAHVWAVQVGYEIVRETFKSADKFRAAKDKDSVYLFDLCCTVLGGGPQTTMVHIFDFPFEAEDDELRKVLVDYGVIKHTKGQQETII